MEIGEDTGTFVKHEHQLVGIKALLAIAEILIELISAVFSVAEKRMTDGSEMCPYLMRSAGHKLNLNKAELLIVITAEYFILRANFFCSLTGVLENFDVIFLLVL